MQCIRFLSRLSAIGVFSHPCLAPARLVTRSRTPQRTRAPSFPAPSAVESFQYFIRMDYVNISSDSPLRRSTWQSLSIRCTKPAKQSARRSFLTTSPSACTQAQKSASWVQTVWESLRCSRLLPAWRTSPTARLS